MKFELGERLDQHPSIKFHIDLNGDDSNAQKLCLALQMTLDGAMTSAGMVLKPKFQLLQRCHLVV